jgi:hypothetical protein
MLDSVGLVAIQVLFVVAAITPVALVLLHRGGRVTARRAEICAIMDVAFGKKVATDAPPPTTPEEGERRRARRALDNNPYISDLAETFEACHSWRQYTFPILSLAILTIGICLILYVWVRIQMSPEWQSGPVARLPLPIVMALAGGYVWTLYQVVTRVRSDELGPSDLIELSLGLLSCVPIGFALSLITLEAKALPSLVAFAASAFPVRDMQRFLQEQMMKRAFAFDAPARTMRPAERNLGTAIDGLSDQTLVRLAELRIVTVLDMAYSDPIRIMMQTGYPLPLVIDWIDQSLLALYVGDKRADLTRMGLRCALDVYEFVELHGLWTPGAGNDPDQGQRGTVTGSDLHVLEVVATKLEVDRELVHDLFLRIYSDPQAVVLRRLWYVHGAPPMVSYKIAA